MRKQETTKRRIAHLIYSQKVGGSETVAANICSHLDRNCFDPMVLFFYKSHGSMPDILSHLGVPYHGFNICRKNILFRPFLIASLLNRLKIDILHVHHVPLYKGVANGVRFSKVKGVIVTEHAKFSISKSLQLQAACKNTAQAVKFFTVVSENLKKYFVEQLDIPSKSIRVINNGIDTKRFSPNGERKKFAEIIPLKNSKKIVINVGRFAEAKDHLTLLSAVHKVLQKRDDLHLVLVGDGELRSAIEMKIDELGLGNHVSLLGSRSDVDKLMPSADIFVLSSKREGLPMVLMEAMSSGLPVVATDVGGIAELVHNNVNGALVPPQNADSLAEAINTILEHPNKALQMGKSARNLIINRYSLDKISESYAALYNSI